MTKPREEPGRRGHGRRAAPRDGPPRPLAGIPVPRLSGIAERPKSLPFYGNYCGRGHGDPTYRKPPMDAACREHNRCYTLLGDFDEGCDRKFAEILPAAIAETPSQEGKNAGLLALAYFSLAEPSLGLGEALFGGGADPRRPGNANPRRRYGERRNAGAGASGRPIGGKQHRKPLLQRQQREHGREGRGPQGPPRAPAQPGHTTFA